MDAGLNSASSSAAAAVVSVPTAVLEREEVEDEPRHVPVRTEIRWVQTKKIDQLFHMARVEPAGGLQGPPEPFEHL
jgi:hypothetical protein